MAKKKNKIKKQKTKKGITKVVKRLPQRGTSNIKKDRKYTAMPPGKRVTAWGTVYYETRANRSDREKWL